nr:Nif3-like dinuclear metal center hexameric protein [uncultured Clostridium sp.]
MIALQLYNKLNADFDLANRKDDWGFMNFNNEYITREFRTDYMGLVLDNTETIEKVYTVTFPDKELIKNIFDRNESDILLFSHHAMGYAASLDGFPFYDIPEEYLAELKKRRISFYMLHSPLDQYGEFSTSVSLARALGLEITQPFCQYDENTKVGVICKTSLKLIRDVQKLIEKTVGHECRLYPYGEDALKEGLVAVAAGGGSYPFAASEVADRGINCYITGFTRPLPHFKPTMEFHKIARDHSINVIGATHYSTEKFACMAMVDYFRSCGLPAEFLAGSWYLEDL